MTKIKKSHKIQKSYPMVYKGNIIILVLCFIVFFPVALILLIKNLKILREDQYQSLYYRGSYGWLIFWTIVLFPIAIILLLINGMDVVEEDI